MSATLSITGTYSSTINNNTIEQLIWVSSNTFYVSLSGSGSIYKVIDGAAETTIGLGNAPGAFAFDSNHNFLYVSLPAASTIVQVSIESDAVNGTIANVNFINYPIGLAYVASTNILYAAVLNKHAIIKMQFNGGVQPTSIETFYDLGLDAQAGYLAFQGTSLFMTDGLNKLIYTFNVNTGVRIALQEANYSCSGITVDSQGSAYFGASNLAAISKYSNATIDNSFFQVSGGAQSLSINPGSSQLYFAPPSTDGLTYIVNPVCYNEDTKILVLNELLEEVYKPVQDLKKGDLVKTYLHGYRKIDMIGKGKLINNPKKWRYCMYKMVASDENCLLEDLVVTGGHNILVDEVSVDDKEKFIEMGLEDYKYKIDDKFLVLASVSDKFIPIETNDSFTYYHFVLESEDDEQHFGVWANGVLSESTQKSQFVKSGMQLL